MKRFIILTLAAALLLGTLSGCSAAESAAPEDTLPPTMTIADADGDETAVLEAVGFAWDSPAEGGNVQSMVADAIHPLDENVLELDKLWFSADSAEPYALTFSRDPASLALTRWDIDDIGDTASEALETLSLTAPYMTELQPGSVYLFHAEFDKVNNCGGDADYYLFIPLQEDPESAVEDALEDDFEENEAADKMKMHFGGGNGNGSYRQTEEYADWMEAVQRSAEIRGGMDAFYTRTLPLLLSGEENSVCSPLNLYLAMAMLAETAGGESRAAILSALNAPDLETVRRNAALLWAADCYDLEEARCLLASSIWLNDRIPVSQAAADALRGNHNAEIFSGVMGTEETDQRLRDWINEKTHDLLKEFTAGLKTQPDTVMDLISTMYFKAAWTDTFEKSFTDRVVFHGLRGDAECDMMHQTRTTSFYRGDGFAAVALGINEGGAMFFLLPDEGVSLSSLLSDPQVSALLRDRAGYDNHTTAQVKMSIPKFDVKSDTDLRQAMTAMGMGALFDSGTADFSPLAVDEPVYLSQAEHAAGLTIDEEGVTGAAYTLFGLAKGAMPPSEIIPFVLDRPFLFAVTARDGSLLFAGTVTDLGE